MAYRGMEVTEIDVTPAKDASQAVAATVRIVFNGCFVVTDIRVLRGKFGLYITFPRTFDPKERTGRNICFPVTSDFQDYLSRKILEAVREVLGHFPVAVPATVREG